MDDLYPIGHISMHAGDHDAHSVIYPWIMTDLGWRQANGNFYNRKVYPRLWAALPDRRRGDEVQVPDLMSRKVELGEPIQLRREQMPLHSHPIKRYIPPISHTHAADVNAGLVTSGQLVGRHPADSWTPRKIGKITRLNKDERGFYVDMTFDSDQFTDTIGSIKNDMKRLLDAEISRAIIDPNHARRIQGLAPITKENSMSGTTRLKTPSKNIKRKDLGVAMKLLGLSDQDELFNTVALVQELKEGQKLYRAYELEKLDLSGVMITIDSEDVAGVLTDAKGGYIYDPVKLVVDGKMANVSGTAFVVVTPPEPVGEDSLRLVTD